MLLGARQMRNVQGKNIAIFDLDGTLCDISHRQHFVRGPRKQRNWKKFFEACSEDVPKWDVIALFNALRGVGWHVEIWSGRSDMVQKQTEKWLFDHGIAVNVSSGVPLTMRPEGDNIKDSELKARFLEAFTRDTGRVPTIIFDDRDQVVEMWRDRGLTCAQVAPGDF